MTTVIPRPWVSGPAPAPLDYGLATASSEQLRADDHATRGVLYEPLSGLSGGVVAVVNDGTQKPAAALTPETFAATAGEFPTIETDPFLIYAGVQAKPVGHSVDDFAERAKAKLALAAYRFIEAGLWATSGASALTAAGVATDLTGSGTAVSPAAGVGLLEEWLADHVGAKGVIHAPRRAGSVLHGARQVTVTGGKQTTRLGMPVAFGAGYANHAPGGAAAAAGVVWLYATGPVLVNRSGMEVWPPARGGQSMDLPHNTSTVYATEVVSVGYEVGVVAVPVQIN